MIGTNKFQVEAGGAATGPVPRARENSRGSSRDRRLRAGPPEVVQRAVTHRQLCAMATQGLEGLEPDTPAPYADLNDIVLWMLARRRLVASTDQMTAALNAVFAVRDKRQAAAIAARRQAWVAPPSAPSFESRVSRRGDTGFTKVADVIPAWRCQHTPKCTGLLVCLRTHAARRRPA
jgi:hypothetical protein